MIKPINSPDHHSAYTSALHKTGEHFLISRTYNIFEFQPILQQSVSRKKHAFQPKLQLQSTTHGYRLERKSTPLAHLSNHFINSIFYKV